MVGRKEDRAGWRRRGAVTETEREARGTRGGDRSVSPPHRAPALLRFGPLVLFRLLLTHNTMSAAGSALQHAWSTDNPVFAAYVFYSGVLVLKMLGTTLLVVRQRFAKKVVMNPEDRMDKNSKVLPTGGDPDVERPRRAHMNDLENIPAFWVTGLLYCLTNPAPALAVNLFRAYTAARIMHTIVYAVVPLPQPSRIIVFVVGVTITTYMAISTIMHFA